MPNTNNSTFLDSVIEKGVTFLLIFTPLAFGTVNQWSISLMEIVTFLIFGIVIIRRGFAIPEGRVLIPVLILFISFVGLVLFQMLPLPDTYLKFLSPATLAVYKQFGIGNSGSHPLTINPYATRQELLKLLAYAAVFFIVVSHYRTKAKIDSLVKRILLMGCFLAVFAVVQKMTWNGRVFWFYPVDEKLRSGSGIWGPYINKNHFAGYMEMAVALGLGLLLYSAPDLKTIPGASMRRKIGQFMADRVFMRFSLLFLAVLIMSASLCMTLSRGGIAGFALSSLFFIWITQKRRSLNRKAGILALLSAVMIISVAFASWERLEQRFEDIEKEEHVNRLEVWRDSLGIVKDYPLFGAGFGSFENTYMRYQKSHSLILFDHAHNDYLEVLTDTGPGGLLIVAGLCLFLFQSVFIRWQKKKSLFGKCVGAGGFSSCAAIAVHSFTDFNLHIPANALLFSAVCGITWSAVFSVGENKPLSYSKKGYPSSLPEREARLSGMQGWGTVKSFASRFILVLLIFIVFIAGKDFLADHYYGRVANILDDPATEELDMKPVSAKTMPDYLQAIASLNKAVALAPSHSFYLKARADLYAKLGRWAQTMESLAGSLPAGALSKQVCFENATADLTKAISLQPTNPDYHLALGQLYHERGDTRADGEFTRALNAFPVNAPLRYSVTMHYLLSGGKDETLRQARILAKIDDSYLFTNLEPEEIAYIRENRAPYYLSTIYGSYLFGAFEIAWRASEDAQVVKQIAPETLQAKEVLQAFLDSKGID